MLKKIVAIKNVGRFRNSGAKGDTHLAKYSHVFGANGHGKTTLCAILRSLQANDPAHLLGRKTLGAVDDASVELLADAGNIRFDGKKWSAAYPDIAIFDGTFISENVHSGEVVETDHKRSLYRVIIGHDGLHLAEEEARLAGESRALTTQITAATKGLAHHVPKGMSLDQFIKLAPEPEIDAKIATRQRVLDAVKEAGQIQARGLLAEIGVPELPGGLDGLLEKTIDEIADGAEKQLADHMAAHGMGADGQGWILHGMAHVDGDTCPFCGQDTKGLPLITAYRSVFSEAYKALKADVKAFRDHVAAQFGDGVVGRLTTLAAQNQRDAEYWRAYCDINTASLAMPAGFTEAARALGQVVLELLDRKAQAPLERVLLDDRFENALKQFRAVEATVGTVNAAIRAANTAIQAKKAETGAADVAAAEQVLAHLLAAKKRHEPAIAKDCEEYVRLTAAKAKAEEDKGKVREQLDAHTEAVVKPYEGRINVLLESFNAGFKIGQTKHAFPGGIATSSYQIIINETPIDLGDGKTPVDRPSFKNTLSAGDRSTLALAFFLAHLERDGKLAKKVVVFDDPFNSQDRFRRTQTIHEIRKIGAKCEQVIVLSHDPAFLKELWERVPAAERSALQIANTHAHGCKINPWDIEQDSQGRSAKEIADLQGYATTGDGKALDIIKKLRPVLETHCRSTFPGCFGDKDWLGDIVRKIREGGVDHPAHALYDELDQINGYTSAFHHGEDVKAQAEPEIDDTELLGFVRRTLRVVNALPA